MANKKIYCGSGKQKTALVGITDFDIATIEALHDLLLDNHGYKLDHYTLTNARKLTKKMYKAFEKERNNG